MTMHIIDDFYKDFNQLENIKGRIIVDPKYVPHKGDRIFLGYAPASIVNDVVFDFEHNMIIINCCTH